MAAPLMKTLRVSVADCEMVPIGGGNVVGSVWAYLTRDVRTLDGQLLVIPGPKRNFGVTGIVDFQVPANDDTNINADDRGFGVIVGWDVARAHTPDQVLTYSRTIVVTTADPAITYFATKATATPVIPLVSYPTEAVVDSKIAVQHIADTAQYVDIAGTETITGAKTFSTVVTSNVTGAAISLTGATNKFITWGTAGLQAPTFTTRSPGTKLVLYEALTGAAADYGFGIDGSVLWSGVPDTTRSFKWYGGTTLAATLTGLGALTLVGGLSATTGSFSSTVGTGALTVTGAATVTTTLGVTGNATVSGGTVTLNNGTQDTIAFATGPFGPPTFTTQSVGTKLRLYPGTLSGSLTEYSIGVETNAMWFNVPQVSTRSFKWYGGTTLAATLTGAGDLSLTGLITKTGEVWNNLSYVNSWVNYGSTFATGQYRLGADGVVRIKGSIKSGTVNPIATLPTGYRPSEDYTFKCASVNGMARIDISTAGVITLIGYDTGGTNAWVSLNQISFPTT